MACETTCPKNRAMSVVDCDDPPHGTVRRLDSRFLRTAEIGMGMSSARRTR